MGISYQSFSPFLTKGILHRDCFKKIRFQCGRREQSSLLRWCSHCGAISKIRDRFLLLDNRCFSHLSITYFGRQ